MNALLVDPENVFDPTVPVVGMPAWWRAFIFQLLNGRQLSVYLYLIMLMESRGVCWPTTEQIAREIGLFSRTMVYEAISVLECYGFVLRSRRKVPGARSRRNVYQRPSCEYTVLQLLRSQRDDERLRNRPALPVGIIDELVDAGLKSMLGTRYAGYAHYAAPAKRAMLAAVLTELLDGARPASMPLDA